MGQASKTVFLTGATGTVGRELLRRIVREPDVRVVCLVRARDDEEAAARIDQTLAETPGSISVEERERICAVAGDLTSAHLGLRPDRWESLIPEVERIVHSAATVKWTLPLGAARQINVEGTRRVLDLAQVCSRGGRLCRFDYISTCMVAGRRAGLIGEEELLGDSGFFNTYEQSKFEAERIVRERRGDLPVSIFRLSMVVGDSTTGYTSSFNVMYWPLKMLSRGLVRIFPGDRRAILDVVPVDYVCDAVETLSADARQRGKCFHLAAGPDCCATLGEMVELAVETFRVRRPVMIPPATFLALVRPVLYAVLWGKRRAVIKRGRIYVPYLSHRALFDTTEARGALEPYGLRPLPVRSYFKRLMDYAIASEWGKGATAPASGRIL